MSEEKISQEFRLKNMDETRSYLIEEMNGNKLISKNHKKVCRVLNYIDHLLIAISTITVSISAFAFLIGIPIGITSSAIGLIICAVTPRNKRYKSIINKRTK